KLQAIARGWLARCLARVLLLQGGCRRELDQASGAWTYVWRYHSVAGAASDNNTRGRGSSESRLSCKAGGGGGGGGGGGREAFFRSWYPPALLKNEALPSPRAATRRVETEGRKREARLAFANSLLEDQKEGLRKRDVRAEWLLALAEVVKTVERATGCLEGAAVDCFGISETSPGFSLRVLHPRGGQPGDGERDAVAAETLAAWRRAETKARQGAAAIRAGHDNRNAKSPRPNSNSPGRQEGGRLQQQQQQSPTSGREPRGRSKREKDVPVKVPTTNDNLADFEQSALEASLHKNALAAVASLLQRKRAVVAIRESDRLGRTKEAWARSGTSPFCIGIQSLPSWLCASRRFIALAHRGRLVAVSQASPFVYWETLVTEESRSQVLRAILEPFLENADLLKAMFEEPSITTTTAATPPYIGGGSSGSRQEGRRDGAWTQPQPPHTTTTTTTASPGGVTASPGNGRSGASEEEPEPGGGSSWGYLSSLAARGCWKVDAAEIARRDDSVELEFDSMAFDVFVRGTDVRSSESHGNKPTSRSNNHSSRTESSARRGDGDDSVPRAIAIVTNAVPFRLGHGLPQELGPLLFDSIADAAVLAGKQADDFLSSSPEKDALFPEKNALVPETGTQKEGDGYQHDPGQGWVRDMWTRKAGPFGTGEVFSHVHRRLDDGGASSSIEVRLRAGPLSAAELAKAGLPKDVSALVV
ncbi:unnamed protein product, partial [Laminaria digitata]